MKRKTICSLALTLLMLLSCLCAAYADTGSVTYDGNARALCSSPAVTTLLPICSRTLRASCPATG